MRDTEKIETLKWIKGWERAGAFMARAKREELDQVDIQRVIENLDDAFESALLHPPYPKPSGLVEQQAWFARMRK